MSDIDEALEALEPIEHTLLKQDVDSYYAERIASIRQALERQLESADNLQKVFERGFRAGLREGHGNKCASCGGAGTIQRGYGPSRCDACDGRGY